MLQVHNPVYRDTASIWRHSRNAAKTTVEPFSRTEYVLHFPLFLAAVAVLMWIFPSDDMLGFGCFAGTGVGLVILWRFLFRDKLLRLTRVGAIGCLLGYSGGTLNTWLTLPRSGESLGAWAGLMRGDLCHGLAVTILAAALLLAAGELLESPLLDSSHRIAVTSGIKRIALAGLVLVVPIIFSGRLRQSGIESNNPGHAGVLAVLFGSVVTPVVILSTMIFLLEGKQGKRIFWGIIAFLLWVLQMDLGRRNLLYAAVTTVSLARHAGYRWNKLTFRQVTLIGIGGVILVVGFLGYQLMRVASYKLENPNLVGQFEVVEGWVEQGRAFKIALTSTQQNVQARTFVVAWFSDLLQLSAQQPTAHGKDTLTQIEEAVPSLFLRNKPTIQEEGIASEQFGRIYPDQANSLLTAGVIDYGLLGAVTYPILFVSLMAYLTRWIRAHLENEVFLYILIVALLATIATEGTLNGYIVTMRDIFVLAAGIYVLLRMPSISIRPHSKAGYLS